MEALTIKINGHQQTALEIKAESAASIHLSWICEKSKSIDIHLSRSDTDTHYEHGSLRCAPGDTIAIAIENVSNADEPIRIRKHVEMVPSGHYEKVQNPDVQKPVVDIGTFSLKYGRKNSIQFNLNSDMFLMFDFLWLGGRDGYAMQQLHVYGSDDYRLPKYQYGETLLIRTSDLSP